jgi:hypothetical protein
MDVVFTHCAGLDVHKKSITACRMVPDPTGLDAEGVTELQTFGTMTIALLVLGRLVDRGGDHPRGDGEYG